MLVLLHNQFDHLWLPYQYHCKWTTFVIHLCGIPSFCHDFHHQFFGDRLTVDWLGVCEIPFVDHIKILATLVTEWLTHGPASWSVPELSSGLNETLVGNAFFQTLDYTYMVSISVIKLLFLVCSLVCRFYPDIWWWKQEDREGLPDDEDKNFIDDEGVPENERYISDGEQNSAGDAPQVDA